MQFRFRLQYQLVKILGISNKEAKHLIEEGAVKVNTTIVSENIPIDETDSIFLHNKCIRKAKQLFYIAWHKPRGIETTLNKEIENNLHTVLNFSFEYFPVGRLDKESEGLLLLTNDGILYNKLIDKKNNIPKTYRVEVDKEINNTLLPFLENGVEIMGKTTLPCKTKHMGTTTFEITLVEGLNRQIRRMCYKAGYTVTRLIRTSFAGITLNIEEKQHRQLTEGEIKTLKTL
ncbi:MAG TPA: pseudouridine synthase [Bacteroidia bacterium]